MSTPETPKPKSKKYRKAVTPGLRRWLYVIFGLFALLGANSLYLSTITALESATGETYENAIPKLERKPRLRRSSWA